MNRAGQYIAVLSGTAEYKAYKPNPLPSFPEIKIDDEMVALLSMARDRVFEYSRCIDILKSGT